jgi:endonuclease/exonuclease/phosphatase family metal-dependent hydrolase
MDSFVRTCVRALAAAGRYSCGMTLRFTAATYNILADAYVRPNRYPDSPAAALEPRARRARLLERIAALDVDLLGLQEVEPAMHEAIAARLAASHLGVHAQRRGRPEGCSVFVRRGKLELIDSEVHHYVARSDDQQLALIARVELEGRRLAFATTHLQWCPDQTAAAEHVGRAQLLELLDVLDEHARGLDRIVGGDFNAVSRSCVVEAALARGLALGAASQRPWDTCNINRRPRKLDYLLYPRERFEPRPDPLPPLRRDTPMPSLVEPSDHLPLRIAFSAST